MFAKLSRSFVLLWTDSKLLSRIQCVEFVTLLVSVLCLFEIVSMKVRVCDTCISFVARARAVLWWRLSVDLFCSFCSAWLCSCSLVSSGLDLG